MAANSSYLNERTYAIVDELVAIAAERGCTPAQVALQWVQSRPGVGSTIIGARTMAQLEDNLGALSVRLSAEEVARLDELSAPTLPFPSEFLEGVRTCIHGGTTIDGESRPPWPLAPEGDHDRW